MHRTLSVKRLVLPCLSIVFGVSLVLGAGSTALAQQPCNSMWLDWVSPGDDADVGTAAAYQLGFSTTAVSTPNDAWWSLSNRLGASSLPAPLPSGTAQSYQVTGLAQGTPYYFVMVAYDEVGNRSPFSNAALGTTAVASLPSAAPQQLAATEDAGDALLSWTGSEPLATEIHIYRAQGASGGSFQGIATLPASDTSFRDTGVSPGTTYRYRAAWAVACGEGPMTADASITLSGTAPPPGAPPAPDATVHAFPNPSTGAVQFVLDVTGASAQQVRVRLYDINGRWVADLAEGSYPPGQHTVPWPRTSREGSRVAAGYYEALGTIGSTKVRERLVLLP